MEYGAACTNVYTTEDSTGRNWLKRKEFVANKAMSRMLAKLKGSGTNPRPRIRPQVTQDFYKGKQYIYVKPVKFRFLFFHQSTRQSG